MKTVPVQKSADETSPNGEGLRSNAGRLVAVVATHNRLDAVQATIARLLDTPEAVLAAVVVVDNASRDGTPGFLAAQTDPRLIALRLPENTGGAGGFAAGMRHAIDHLSPDWLVVMDDDARPVPGALAAFHAHDRTGAEAWAAAVYHPDGRICDINRPSLNPFWHRTMFLHTAVRGREGFHLGPADFAGDRTRPVDGVSFVGLFLSRAAVDRAGLPDARLFLYGDDVIYTLGLRRAGGTILFDPGLKFEHDTHARLAGARRLTPLWRSYYHHRNLTMAYRMAAGPWFWIVLPVVVARWLWAVRDYRGERRRFLRLTLRALSHGLARRLDVSHTQVRQWAGEPPDTGA